MQLRNFANKQSLYESQDVGKRKPKYVKIDEAFIEEVVQAGPPQVYKVDPPTVLPLFQWDVEVSAGISKGLTRSYKVSFADDGQIELAGLSTYTRLPYFCSLLHRVAHA